MPKEEIEVNWGWRQGEKSRRVLPRLFKACLDSPLHGWNDIAKKKRKL